MKLLFDENLSPALVLRLQDVFPESQHVHGLGLGQAEDHVVWSYARTHGFAIATKDRDFLLQCAAFGHPPRVILLRVGNCTVSMIETVLRKNVERLAGFEAQNTDSYIVLSR